MYTCSSCAVGDCPNYHTLADAKGCDKYIDGHTCSYCACDRESNDPSVLCKDCRETFGHTMFDEL